MPVHRRGRIQRPEIQALSSVSMHMLLLGAQHTREVPRMGFLAGGYRAAAHAHHDGQGLVEFAFILVLVVLACVASVVAFGTALDEYYAAIISGLPF